MLLMNETNRTLCLMITYVYIVYDITYIFYDTLLHDSLLFMHQRDMDKFVYMKFFIIIIYY